MDDKKEKEEKIKGRLTKFNYTRFQGLEGL